MDEVTEGQVKGAGSLFGVGSLLGGLGWLFGAAWGETVVGAAIEAHIIALGAAAEASGGMAAPLVATGETVAAAEAVGAATSAASGLAAAAGA